MATPQATAATAWPGQLLAMSREALSISQTIRPHAIPPLPQPSTPSPPTELTGNRVRILPITVPHYSHIHTYPT